MLLLYIYIYIYNGGRGRAGADRREKTVLLFYIFIYVEEVVGQELVGGERWRISHFMCELYMHMNDI